MPIDIHARAANVVTTPLIILRWIVVVAQILVTLGSEVLFDIPLPAKPLFAITFTAVMVNLYAMTIQKRRQVSEPVMLWYFLFDVAQFCAFLFFTGGTDNPFCILLLAPLAMAASLLSLYSLCLLIMWTVLLVSVLSFAAVPLLWPDPAPLLSPSYRHGAWVALLVAMVFISFVVWRVAMETRRVNDALVLTRGILEEKRRVSSLGALAAAAVHELGSPLATIAVVTKEMQIDTHPDDPFAEDIAILRDQTEKCKKILADLARNPDKKMEDTNQPLRLDRMLMEIASEYGGDARSVSCEVASRVPENLPTLPKTPALEYGLGNLIGNAMSYAREQVRVAAEGDAEFITIAIRDDGPGFSANVLQTVGQPYISTRETSRAHMGLGIFISINLLEATGARLHFANAQNGPKGAIITVTWPRTVLEAPGAVG